MIDDKNDITAITHANHINTRAHKAVMILMKVVSTDVKGGL
jgi:hypothetical protein